MRRCLTDEELDLLARAEPPPREAELHLEACEVCAAAAARIRRDEALFGELSRVARERLSPGAALGPELAASLPDYEIREELHRGGQGVVYRATQHATNRPVALKLLLAGRRASFRERLRFEREVDLASRLRHPAIVTIFGGGVADGVPYYAMEYVEGERLDTYVAGEHPGLRARLELFGAVAEAVVHAHRHGVIHRDLKPGNVLVDREGRPHVLDFGVAKAAGDESLRVTATGEFAGTLAYASPEQLSGDPTAVDARTDVYSLGVCLYEMLTGRLPYAVGGRVPEVLAGIVSAPPHDPTTDPELSGRVDGELWTILEKALEKDPDVRYSSVEALLRDVRHYLAGEPLEARPPSLGYVLRKRLRRHRGKVLAAAGLLVVALVSTVLVVRQRLRAERQSERAVLVREVFQDVLSAASPRRMGPDVRLVDVFEEASRRIEEALVAAPDVQAAVQFTIGDTYRTMLLPREAEPHLANALDRLGRSPEADPDSLSRCMNALGLVWAALERTGEAVALQERALELRRRAFGDEDPRTAESERSLALALLSGYDRPDEESARARRLLRSALERFEAALGPRHPEVAETAVVLARHLEGAEREALLRRALSILDEAEGEEARLVQCLNGYAAFLHSEGRLDEAETLLDRSLELSRRTYGDELVGSMLRRQARLAYDRGDEVLSESLTREALASELGLLARRRPAEREELERVARELLEAGHPERRPPYVAAFRALRRIQGDGAFELASWMNDIVRNLQRMPGRHDEARALLEEAKAIHCRLYGADCPIRFVSLVLVARNGLDAATKEGLAEAERSLGEATEMMGRCGCEDQPEYVAAMADLRRATVPPEDAP